MTIDHCFAQGIESCQVASTDLKDGQKFWIAREPEIFITLSFGFVLRKEAARYREARGLREEPNSHKVSTFLL